MEFGTFRRITLWGVIFSAIASLTMSGFFMILTLSSVLGTSSPGGSLSGGSLYSHPLMSILSPLSSLAHMAFIVCVVGHLYAIHRDFTHVDRSLEYMRHGMLRDVDQPFVPK